MSYQHVKEVYLAKGSKNKLALLLFFIFSFYFQSFPCTCFLWHNNQL